jgi:hypothetical protein
MRELFGNIKNRLEADFSFGCEMNLTQRLVVVLGDAFVELFVFLLGDFRRFAHPNWLQAVDLFPIPNSFFDALGFRLRFFSFLLNFTFLFRLYCFLLNWLIDGNCLKERR